MFRQSVIARFQFRLENGKRKESSEGKHFGSALARPEGLSYLFGEQKMGAKLANFFLIFRHLSPASVCILREMRAPKESSSNSALSGQN